MAILRIRDDLAEVRDLVGCLYLACRNVEAGDERAALTAVSHTVRERLTAIDEALQNLIGSTRAEVGRKTMGS